MKNKIIRFWIPGFFLIATPAFCYVIFEWITGNLNNIQGEYIVWNLLFYYAIYAVFLLITNRVRISYLALNLLFTIWAVVDFFVVQLRTRPVMLPDIMAWQTAATVAGNYRYEIPPRMVHAILLMVVWSILVLLFPFRMPRGKKRVIPAAALLTGSIGWYCCFFNWVVPVKGIDVSMWAPNESYETKGYLLCTARMLSYLYAKAPDGYHYSTVSRMYDELEPLPAEGDSPVNIICIMNESWADLRVIADFETNLPSFSYYDSMTENCIKGYVYVPVFGSMTSNTEYEFLTANSIAFAPVGSVPFQIYMDGHTPSILDTVSAEGYETIAMHPYPADNWNRTQAYQSLGFDQFLDEPYFLDSPRIRGYVSDRGCYEKIIQLTEESGDQRQFFFLVTMQNHGGYAQEYEAQVKLSDYADFPETEQYLSLIRESDEALEYLIEYYWQSDQPTLIVMFGDHQPSVETEFFETLYGCDFSELNIEEYARMYETPYLIWTNYENKLEEQTDFSVVYLSNQVLKAANLPLNGYQNFLEELKSMFPVIHFMGYLDIYEGWQDWTDWKQKASYQWFHLLDLYQYYRMSGSKR